MNAAVERGTGDLFYKGLRVLDLDGYGHHENYVWLKKKIQPHAGVEHVLCSLYRETAQAEGIRQANINLREQCDQLRVTGAGISAASSDSVIREKADLIAKNLKRESTKLLTLYDVPTVFQYIEAVVLKFGVEVPVKEKQRDDMDAQLGAIARVSCDKWWRRQLRRECARTVEHFFRSWGWVSRRRGAYVSGFSLARRREQHSRNAETLKGLEAVSSEGDQVNLFEAAQASVSNPANRRAELMTRIKGYDDLAQAAGLEALFITLTCPSKYHASHKSGVRNKKYQGATPREAQDYLCNIWSKIRATWNKAGIRVFGVRVAEPHHDGTPHWHLLLYISADQADAAAEVFGRFALKEDGSERGAVAHRWECVNLSRQAPRLDKDGNPCRPVSYIAKYISKNIDGHGVKKDFESEQPADESAQRVEAWAGVWGIRQFQTIGNSSVTVWRELRRMREAITETHGKDWEAIRDAADRGDWAAFVELMGGALVTRDGQTLRAFMVKVEKLGRYGEEVERIKGLFMRAASLHIGITRARLETRAKHWEVRSVCHKATRRKAVASDSCQ